MKHTDKKMPPVQGGKESNRHEIINHIIGLVVILLVLLTISSYLGGA